MISYLKAIKHDILHLIAPSLCPACDEPIDPAERGICEACRVSLLAAPYPEEIYETLLEEYTAEELALEAIGSLYTFEQDSPVQQLIHAIKYKGCYPLAEEMGVELGLALKAFVEFSQIDLVLPVPLHRAKLRERGYNQAEFIARGFSRAHNIELMSNGLKRIRHTRSQTQLSAQQRAVNISNAFTVTVKDTAGAKILLCDDVFTTGATLNACADVLLNAGAQSVIAATIAQDNPNTNVRRGT
ncbi:MAG: ComF family protein [Chlorobi bacterium]|nr:ComF family protein [Chlorobiota bacterium]